MRLDWRGYGVDEQGVDVEFSDVRVRIDPHLCRPTRVDLLLGKPTNAREKLARDSKATFEELVRPNVEE